MSVPGDLAEWQAVNASAEAASQVSDAMADLNVPADAYLRWPWPELDALYGGMAPGTTHYVVGFSGMGKTTMITSALDRWERAGIRLDVLPLELKANTFRTYMACQSVGIDPGLMLSGDYHKLLNWKELRGKVFDALLTQNDRETIRVRSTDFVDVGALELACAEAQERGARALVVDHIDHIEAGARYTSQVEASVAVNKAAFRLAKDYRLVLILMSQANNDALKANGDHLAKYHPLRDTSVWMGAYKRQVATGMLGLFRPTRAMAPGESLEDFQGAMKRARSGDDPPGGVLMAGRAGLSLMKSRNYGSREGQRMQLSVRDGYYDELDAPERADDEARRHGIRTSTGLTLSRGV